MASLGREGFQGQVGEKRDLLHAFLVGRGHQKNRAGEVPDDHGVDVKFHPCGGRLKVSAFAQEEFRILLGFVIPFKDAFYDVVFFPQCQKVVCFALGHTVGVFFGNVQVEVVAHEVGVRVV